MKLIKNKINVIFKKKLKLNKENKILKKSFLISLLTVYYFFLIINTKKIIIEVDISKVKSEGRGPIQLQKGLYKILPYETKKCKFIPADDIPPISNDIKKEVDFFYLSSFKGEIIYDKWKFYNRTKALLLGPNFVPIRWFYFPWNKYWNERRFKEILESIKGVVVHSLRVRDHLAIKSNNTNLLNKFIILRPCTHIMPNDIISFKERTIDIIFYEKYSDLNHSKQAKQLLELLNNTSLSVKRLLYLNYSQNYQFLLAKNSKFIIYFSFYDTGAIALKEIQNYGVIAFTLQKDLAISNITSYYIPELEYDDIKPAFNKIIQKINVILKINIDTKKIANINQSINRCEKALDDLCEGITHEQRTYIK